MNNSQIIFENVNPGQLLTQQDSMHGHNILFSLQNLNLKERDEVTIRFSGFESDSLTPINGTELTETVTINANDIARGELHYHVDAAYLKPIGVGTIRAIASLKDGTSYTTSAPVDYQVSQPSDGSPNLI